VFSETPIGQPRIRRILERIRTSGRLPHALLFWGPEGTGKTAAAIELARSLHCDRGETGACGECAPCGRTGTLGHADFNVIVPAMRTTKDAELRRVAEEAVSDPYGYPMPDEGTSVVVERLREAVKEFTLGSFEGGWRTMVFLDAHRIRPESAPILLKTLEEPPEQSLMILTAPAPERLLPTIVSRCQALAFPPVSRTELKAHLTSLTSVSETVAEYAADASGGSLRRAIALTGEDVAGLQARASRFLEALVTGREAQTFVALEHLASDKQEVFDVLQAAEIWLADTLRFRQRGEAAFAPEAPRIQTLRELSSLFDEKLIDTAAREIERIRDMSLRNINLQVSLVSMWRTLQRAV